MARRRIDWSPIEVDVRLGKMSKTAIAQKHGVSESSLRLKCREHGWESDLTPVVQAATRAELAKQARERANEVALEAASKSAAENVKAITSSIDAAVAENVSVINRHRAMASALMDLVDGLSNEVKTLSKSANSDVEKALSLGDRVDAVRKLSQTVATVVQVERQAHNLDEKGDDPNAYEASLRKLEEMQHGGE